MIFFHFSDFLLCDLHPCGTGVQNCSSVLPPGAHPFEWPRCNLSTHTHTQTKNTQTHKQTNKHTHTNKKTHTHTQTKHTNSFIRNYSDKISGVIAQLFEIRYRKKMLLASRMHHFMTPCILVTLVFNSIFYALMCGVVFKSYRNVRVLCYCSVVWCGVVGCVVL